MFVDNAFVLILKQYTIPETTTQCRQTNQELFRAALHRAAYRRSLAIYGLTQPGMKILVML
jgi:hypothetical protein